MNDQTAKRDEGKLQLMQVPPEVIEDIAEVRMYGNAKYGNPDNWKDVEESRYWNALFRHLIACMRDPKAVDLESGIEHYKHIACNIAFICALEREKREKIITVDELMQMAEPDVIRVPQEIQGDDCASRRPEDDIVEKREECKKCVFRVKAGSLYICDYLSKAGKARGNYPSECEIWKEEGKKAKRQYRHTCKRCGVKFVNFAANQKLCDNCRKEVMDAGEERGREEEQE